MQRKYSIGKFALASGLIIFCAPHAGAQDVEANPPDVSPATGIYSTGSNILGSIESVNPVNGNVTLSFPIAQLPPDNVSLSAGVSLVYNSAIYDAPTYPLIGGTTANMVYEPSAHGGGWNYGYKYKLWAQPRIPPGLVTSGVCGLLTSNEKTYWYKNFLQTPDGSNHILYRVSAVPATGGPTDDPANTGYLSTDFDGFGNPNSICTTQQQYTGKLVFATVDGTYIRVEVTTAPGGSGSWIGYLPNGTQISGPVFTAQVPGENYYADDSPAGTITDRNNNEIFISPLCRTGAACTDTITDVPGRTIQVSYVSSGSTSNNWTDTISWNGPNGALSATVSSSLITAPSYSYPCGITASGSDGLDCILTASLWQVNSIQMAPATSGGDQTTFAFNYTSSGTNNWGELHTLQKCSGVALTTCAQPQWSVNYQYVFDNGSLNSRPPGDSISPIQKRTLTYTENLDRVGSTPITETTNYSIWYQPNSAYTFYGGESITPANTITNPDGSVTTLSLSSLCATGTAARDTCSPVVYKTVNPDNSTTQLMWTWNQSLPAGIPAGTLFNLYPEITAETRAGTTRGSNVSRDTNGNVTGISRYDWGSTATDNANGLMTSLSGTVLQTIAPYYYEQSAGIEYWNSNTNQGNLRAVESETVNGNELAKYSYDNPYTTANLIGIQQWDSGQMGWISQSMSYLSNGNITSQTDGDHHLTAICYDSDNHLYPVTTVVAASSYSCPTPPENPEGRTTAYSSDFFSGVMKSATDTDNNLATSYTYDNLGRQLSASQTGAGSLARTSTTVYDDVGLTVQTTQSDTGSGSLVSTTGYDALGRATLVTDGAGHKTAEAYRYDASNGKMRYVLQSNAYGAGSSPDAMTAGWSLTKLDSVGRTIEVDHYSGTTPPSPWVTGSTAPLTGRATIAYDQNISGCTGPATQITDEAGNAHWNCTDGLDRLTRVTEPDASSGTYGTVTTYGYDSILGNLSTVDSVGGLTITCPNSTTHLRCFTYSTMSRLLSATSPESGTVTYTYDNNGNLLTETDANGSITTVAGYDGLNRPVGSVANGPAVTYTTGNSGNPTVATPPVYYAYDQDFKGALSSVCTSTSSPCASSTAVSATTYTHDGFGRISRSAQTTGGQGPYGFTYGYSLTDQLTSMTYPSGRQVTYNLDASDRVTAINNVTDGGTYATGIGYTADGGIYGMTVGQGVAQNVTWNDRLQPTGIAVNATGGSPLLTLGLFPCPGNVTACSSGNNGNLQGQTITTPSLSLTQLYGYDRLNRLTSAQESGGGAPWGQGYGYDTLGNRWVSANGGLPALTNETPQSSSWFSTTVPNRIAVSGWNYDKNGNLLQVGGVGSSYSYDAANEQVTASVNGIAAQYVYDGNGERVEKTISGASTIYVYDAFGNLASEYSSQTQTLPCGQSICYPALDHLGSARLVTDGNGSSVLPSVLRWYDYQPFGTELLAGIDGRSTGNGYLPSADGYLEKYTGQQRDQESTLDWFQARYMDGMQGRFQTPDPGSVGAQLGDPQTWNGYSYVENNPLSITDPSGLGFWSDFLHLGETTGKIAGEILGAAFGEFFLSEAIDGAIGASASGGAWGEQLPAGVGIAGTLNTGTVFGGGSTGSVVFNATDAEQSQASALGAFILKSPGLIVDEFRLGMTSFFRHAAQGPAPFILNGQRVEVSIGEVTPPEVDLETLTREAEVLYPSKAGRFELHHVTPKYLGGAEAGPKVQVPAAYHQLITNAFRALVPYGAKAILTGAELEKVLKQVYSQFPLP